MKLSDLKNRISGEVWIYKMGSRDRLYEGSMSELPPELESSDVAMMYGVGYDIIEIKIF